MIDPRPIGGRRRSAASLDNDERILDAAVFELAASGFDAFSHTRVASTAGLRSASAVYNRFETPHDLAFAAWDGRLRVPFFDLLEDAASLLDDPSVARASRLTDAISPPAPWLVAALTLLGCSHRDAFVDEVTGAELRLFVESHREAREAAGRVRLLGALCSILGPALLSVSPAAPRARWSDWFLGHAALERDRTTYPGSGAPIDPPPLTIDTGDPVRDRLVVAFGRLVGEIGLTHTTVGRAARRAGYSTGAVYDRYPGRDGLVTDAITTLLTTYMAQMHRRTASAGIAGTLGRDGAAFLRGAFSPEWIWFERCRVEFHIAAAHDSQVARTIGDLHRAALDQGLDQMGAMDAASREEMATAAVSFRALMLGASFLDSVVGGIGDLDWRPYVVPFLEAD